MVLSGWADTIRDHGQLIFIDIRDNYGITQCVVDNVNAAFGAASGVRPESVLRIEGKVVRREGHAINPELPTGEIEIQIGSIEVLSPSDPLPFAVADETATSEELRLRYRYLDLRRHKLHQNIVLRTRMIRMFREKLTARGFLEMQTPILTASSPEGARDFLVPSRLHPGKFFALPQSPQQFKQLLMIAGFDRYFQIAPCFRDEAARADRSPGEHYQVDLEMSFVGQDDVFAIVEPILFEVFDELGDKRVSPHPFRRIPYREALLRYGTDKPDLRNPLLIHDVTGFFRRDDVNFNVFKSLVAAGAAVRGIFVPGCATRPRAWFDRFDERIRSEGGGGLAYILFGDEGSRGPIAKFFPTWLWRNCGQAFRPSSGGAMFFVCDDAKRVAKLARRGTHDARG